MSLMSRLLSEGMGGGEVGCPNGREVKSLLQDISQDLETLLNIGICEICRCLIFKEDYVCACNESSPD